MKEDRLLRNQVRMSLKLTLPSSPMQQQYVLPYAGASPTQAERGGCRGNSTGLLCSNDLDGLGLPL